MGDVTKSIESAANRAPILQRIGEFEATHPLPFGVGRNNVNGSHRVGSNVGTSMSDNGLAPCGKRSGNSQTSEQQEVRSDRNQNSPWYLGKISMNPIQVCS
jgi:hypothetical protein